MGGRGVEAAGNSAEPLLRHPDRYRAKYVAVHDGEVILEADTHEALVRKVRAEHLAAGSYVARYVDVPPVEVVVGVG